MYTERDLEAQNGNPGKEGSNFVRLGLRSKVAGQAEMR
jgi:hypothetical protein